MSFRRDTKSRRTDRTPRHGESRQGRSETMGEPHAGERQYTEVLAGPQRGRTPERSGLSVADRSRASGTPSSSECRGEQHCCERPDTMSGPVRSETMDGVASRHERRDQTENTRPDEE
jgi:hypothetical protein